MNSAIILPPKNSEEHARVLSNIGQVTIIGANGAGKTRFMNYMQKINERPSMVLSALSAFYSPRKQDSQSTVDIKYTQKIPKGLRDDSLPQIDKLIQMLFHDEFSYLLKSKTDKLLRGKPMRLEPTKLDKMIQLWQDIFPGNQIISEAGTMLFSTESGDNLISSSSLSSGEKAVLYYIAGVLYADADSIIFVDNPSMFMHPAILNTVWNAIEGLRPDCSFVYNTADMEFVNSRTGNLCIWVRSHNVHQMTWDYDVLGKGNLPEDLFVNLMGSRRPVLFIEGDAEHSIDAKLYPLVFRRYTVRSLGSCNKVIESTRSFNDLSNIHKLESKGLVDRDRRTNDEVAYLRRKNIMVPEVAEVENIFLVEDVVKTMALYRRKNPGSVFEKVKKSVLKMFESHYKEQALQHVRHRMKRALEYRGDVKVKTINELERHLRSLPEIINVKEEYDGLIYSFQQLIKKKDYKGILKVFNHKPMLPESRVASLLGFKDKDSYIRGVLKLLKENSPLSHKLRSAMLSVFQSQ